MSRVCVLFAAVGVLAAQDAGDLFNKPPAAVDRALRERITEFYQLQINHEYRKAEAFAAEDTKDFYYNGQKLQFLSFEIQKIKYNDDLSKAEATILVERMIDQPGFAGHPVKFPLPSFWKLEGGKWCWWVDRDKLRDTPFGRMTPGPALPGGSSDPLAKAPATAVKDNLLAQVKPDRASIDMSPGTVEHVTVTNDSAGPVAFDVSSDASGLRLWMDHKDLKSGEKATLAITALDTATSGTVHLSIRPFGPVIEIKVNVK